MIDSGQGDGGTKEALLSAATEVFAEKGFEVGSVREITGMAGVNVASVNYHFGSREGLVDAVVERMVCPVNDERLRRLNELEGAGEVSLRGLLSAFMEPLVTEVRGSRMCEDLFCRLMGRLMGDQPYEFPGEVMGQFQEVAGRFVRAVMEVCPWLSREEVFWRIHFSFGVLSVTLMHGGVLKKISNGVVGDEDLKVVMGRVIDFCEAGFEKGKVEK